MDAHYRIMLVDDDPVQLAILNAYFTSLGVHRIEEFRGAEAALQALSAGSGGDSSQNRADGTGTLVVTDLKMAGMDGIEFLRRLAEKGFYGSVAIISSAPSQLVDSAAKLARMHGLQLIGTCRKPLTREALDKAFLSRLPARHATPSSSLPRFSDDEVAAAIKRDEFIPFYQPKLSLPAETITGAEALARWQHPEFGTLSPARFLEAVERRGLSPQLTFQLIDRVLADLRKWADAGLKMKVSVNITAHELALIDLPEMLTERMARSRIRPDQLIIEVTENAIVEFNAISLEVLSRLRLGGFEVAVDDFGTGYSNIQSIRDFPYSELKIDQSFVRGVGSDPFLQESVTSSITLGRQMNMRLIAEGVESQSDFDFLRKRGVDEIQGYLISKPVPAREFVDFCMRHAPGSISGSAARSTAA